MNACRESDVAGMSAKHVLMVNTIKMVSSSLRSNISKQQLTLLLLLGCGGILAASAAATTTSSSNNDGTENKHLLRSGNNKSGSVSNSIESTEAEALPWYHPTRMLVPNVFCPAPDTITTLPNVRTGQYGSSTGDCFYMYWDPSKCDLASGKTCPLYGKSEQVFCNSVCAHAHQILILIYGVLLLPSFSISVC